MGLREHLEKQRAEDYELLKEYENTLRTEIDPRLKLKWKEDIKEVKQRIRECEEELGSLSASSVQPEPVTPYPSPPATSPSEPEQEVKPPTQQLELQKHREQEEYQPRRSWLFVSRWNRSDVIALSSLIVAMIVGVAIPEVRCFVGLQSESCPSSQTTPISPNEPTLDNEQPKPSPPTTIVEPDTNLISKATGIDYTQLHNLLAAGKWKEADQETTRMMLQATGSEKEGWFSKEDIEDFSCEDLRIIDELWLDYSDGKFGFSVQKDIYKELGGTEKILSSWATKVGWKVGDKWFSWFQRPNFTFNFTFKTAPKGQLPTYIYDSLIDKHRREGEEYAVYICSRAAGLECVIERAQIRIVPMGEMFSKADECL